MFLPAGKFLFWLLIAFISAEAQPDFVYHACDSGANYTTNSTYRRNLDTVLTTLPTTNFGFGFFNHTIGQGSNMAYSFALCRGDLEPGLCQSCVNDSIVKLREKCPNQMAAIGYYEYCYLRYSSQTILVEDWMKIDMYLWSPQNASVNDQLQEAVRPLMDDLVNTAAAGGSLIKFATGETRRPNYSTIYGLVQCTPDLRAQQCKLCLGNAIGQFLNAYGGRLGGRAFARRCNFRYETYIFYNNNNTAVTPLPPSSSQPSPPASSTGKNTSKTIIVTIIVIVSVNILIVITAFCIFTRLRTRKKTPTTKNIDTETMEIHSIKSLQYDFEIVKIATNDFSEDNKLGQGGFGAVHKGKLADGQEIAVKRLAKDSGQGDMEFKNEVLLLAKLQHRNLVRLLGFSIEGSERLLIYEFLPNASLDQFIFDPIKRTILEWEKRYKIIKGVAKGLLYLHEDSRLRIVHRDLKASNVLLDAQMNAKIADFGMARLFNPEETQGDTSRIVGTYGYMAPEYAMHGQFSGKSDVFSFGVLVLEMVTGQKNASFRNGETIEDLISFAWKSWHNGTTTNMIDPTLKTRSGSLHDIIRSIHIGLLCVQDKVVDRPTMASVVLMLHSFTITLGVPSEPAFFMPTGTNPEMPLFEEYVSSPSSCSLAKSKSSQISVNDVSKSEIVPR